MEHAYILQPKERPFSDLYLCFCGYEECRPGHSFGPAVRPCYILHYIVSGKGVYQAGGTSYELEAGQGFLIPPGSQTFYQADAHEPWTYLWIGFDGDQAAKYLADIGLGGSRLTFRSSRGQLIQDTVLSMLEHKTGSVSNQFLLEGLLYSFFHILAEDTDVYPSSGSEADSQYVRQAMEFIQNSYCTPIRVADIADYVSINRSYLYSLFRKELQMSPQEYLSNYRLTQAAELLLITDLSVEGAALSCGYTDPLVFSKAFKRKYGLTPSQYRKGKAPLFSETRSRQHFD